MSDEVLTTTCHGYQKAYYVSLRSTSAESSCCEAKTSAVPPSSTSLSNSAQRWLLRPTDRSRSQAKTGSNTKTKTIVAKKSRAGKASTSLSTRISTAAMAQAMQTTAKAILFIVLVSGIGLTYCNLSGGRRKQLYSTVCCRRIDWMLN